MKGGRLGPYRVLEDLGAGSTAKVYLAEVVDAAVGLERGRRVALKVLHSRFEATPRVLRRFLQEVRVGRALEHDNVVRVLDAGAFDVRGRSRHFLSMEYVQGRTLREVIEGEGVQQESLCRHIGCEVARGLDAIHGSGVVHRDIKPENIVITRDQQVKIMDLGIARIRDETVRVSQSGDFIGSVLYAAPEQFRKKSHALDGRADLYALGLTLYELVTGVHPFERDTIEEVMQLQLREMPRAPGELNPQLSPFFEYVLLRLLRKSREQRFRSAATLCRTLEEAEDSAWWRERACVIRRMSRRPLRRPRLPRETTVHGREEELATLRDLWNDVTQGNGLALALVGEAGIGKSRLVDEFAARVHAAGEDLHYLFGAWPSVGPATATGALSTAYREHFGTGDLQEALAPFLTETPVFVRPFAALLRGESPPPETEPLRPDALHTVFINVTRALALEQPTLVLLEDLHQAPPEGRAVVSALAQAIRHHRVMLVITMRPEIPPSWLADLSRLDHARRTTLGRLRVEDVFPLLTEALGSTRRARALAPRITDLSDGNPLFLFEILHSLRDSGVLDAEPGGASTLRGTLGDVKSPPRLRDLVQARLAGLSTRDRELLDAAATFGFEFDPALLADVLAQLRLQVLQALGRLERSHRLVRSRGRTCTFDHHVLQEVLYADLSPALREAYHAAIGEVLDKRLSASGEDPAHSGREAVQACHHFLLARHGAAALPYLASALDHLEQGYLSARAAELTGRVLAIPGLVEGSRRAELLLRKARCLHLMGRQAEEVRALEEAVRMASPKHQPLLASRATSRLADHLRGAGYPARALGFFEQAIQLARRAGSDRAESETMGRLGVALDELGRHAEARAMQERFLSFAQRIGDRHAEAEARGNLASALFHLGEIERALEELRTSLTLFELTSDIQQQGRAAANLGSFLVSLGRYDEARPFIERGLDIARMVGYRGGEASALGNLGALSQSRGDLAEAASFCEQDLSIQEECGNPLGEGLALVNLAGLDRILGRHARARARLDEALHRFREVGYRRGEARAALLQAVVADEEEREEDARTLFRRAAALCEETGALRDAVTVRLEWARSLVWRKRDDAARAVLGALAPGWEATGSPDAVLLRRALAVALGGEGAEAVRGACGPRVTPLTRLEARALLWRAQEGAEDLQAAHLELEELRERAPAIARGAFSSCSRVRRAIEGAWRASHATIDDSGRIGVS